MTALPQVQALLLEIHQSLGRETYQTKIKDNFAQGRGTIESLKDMGSEILESIFEGLDMDPRARLDAIDSLMEFGNAHKFLELNIWTFAADQRQVLWSLLSHFYIPSLARRIAFWNLGQPMDKGMPGGRFWYLPDLREEDGQTSIHMPVAQVVDWLLDLLGTSSKQEVASLLGQSQKADEFLRSLYNWRKGTSTITAQKIDEYFAGDDNAKLDFKGVFTPDPKQTPAEQFDQALEFVQRKGLTASALRLEISMTQEGVLEAVLNRQVDEATQATFVHHLAERYAQPTMTTIRRRLRVARMVQDGYIRLLKTLCPGTDPLCADPQQNKLLQLFALYKLVYNLTIDAWRHCHHLGEAAENQWFDEHLPPWDKHSLLLSITPSLRSMGNQVLAHWLTRQFFDMQPGAPLEDCFPLDAAQAPAILQRKLERIQEFDDEIARENQLVERIKTSSHWRALQGETSFWVVGQVAQNPAISPLARQAATQRLRELASTPAQTVQTITLELHAYLNAEKRHRPKDVQTQVNALLAEAEASEGYALWKAPLLQYKAKHLLACNDFAGAERCFKDALEAGRERNYGPFVGEAGRDGLACAVANQRLLTDNHNPYYRAILQGDVVDCSDQIPSIQDVARAVARYFWDTLYKPYPGVEAEQRRSLAETQKILRGLMPLFQSGDRAGMQKWVKSQRKLFASRLPDVDGNSVLMALLKMRDNFQAVPQWARQEKLAEAWSATLQNWRWLIAHIAQQATPKQLNLEDLKGQTPLMLMAEDGDAELVAALLQAGADPDLQDIRGLTALHSACKSHVDACVDALLDHPCQLNITTHEEQRSALHTATWAGHVHAVKRLSQLAPALVRSCDVLGQTPLEMAEDLLEHPDKLQALAQERARSGKRCASVSELQEIVHVLEAA